MNRPATALARAGVVGLLVFGLGAAQTLAPAAGREKLVIQVNDSDPRVWRQALNIADNVEEIHGRDNVDIEIVTFGPGLAMFRRDSVVRDRLEQALADGVGLRACGLALKRAGLTEKDLHAGAAVVPSGIVHIMNRQTQGWRYVRP